MSSTTGSSLRIASSSGRVSRKSSPKMSSSISDHFAALGLGDALRLDAQELLLVVPLVQRLGLVEALVALQADEASARHLGHRLGQLGLARAGGTLDQHRLLQPLGEVHDARDAFVGEVVDLAQTVADFGDGLEAIVHRMHTTGALDRRGQDDCPGSGADVAVAVDDVLRRS